MVRWVGLGCQWSPSMHLQKPLQKEGLWPGACYGNNGHSFFFPSPRGRAEDAGVCFSPGDTVYCTHLRLEWVVSAWPHSPCSVGAKRDSWSTYCLWTAAEGREARLKVKKKKSKAIWPGAASSYRQERTCLSG